DERSIPQDAGAPELVSARTDPTDPRAVESDGRLRTQGIGFCGGSLTICLVPITLNPTGAVGDGRIRILVARSRRRHLERIHYDQRILRGRVLLAGPFD